jgi:hypothetical protein
MVWVVGSPLGASEAVKSAGTSAVVAGSEEAPSRERLSEARRKKRWSQRWGARVGTSAVRLT